MTESNTCTYQQTTDQITNINNDPVFQHLAYRNLLLQKRNRQQTVSGKQLTSCDQNHRKSTREYAGTDKFSKRWLCDGYGNCCRSDTTKSDECTCKNCKYDHFRNRCVYLTLSGCNVVSGHFGRCKKVHNYTSLNIRTSKMFSSILRMYILLLLLYLF